MAVASFIPASLGTTPAVSGITDTVGTVYTRQAGTTIFNSSTLAGGPNGGTMQVEIWAGKAAGTNAANSIAVTITGSPTRVVASVAQYSGVLARGATNASSDGSRTNTNPTVSMTTQDKNNFMVTAIGTNTANAAIQPYLSQNGTIETTDVAGALNQRVRCALVDNTSVPPALVTCSVTIGSGPSWACATYEQKVFAPVLRPNGSLSTRGDPASQNGARI